MVGNSIPATPALAVDAALSYILRTKPDRNAREWQDHARMAAMMEKISVIADYQYGRTARSCVSPWDVPNGGGARIIVGERQREGFLPPGEIKAPRREQIIGW